MGARPINESSTESQLARFAHLLNNTSIITGVYDLLQGAEGVQIFFDLIVRDPKSNTSELVDRFAINVTIAVGSTMTEMHFGIFTVAEVNISFTLVCEENYYGADCDRFCNESCTCGSGSTGINCTESINDCATYKENQGCLDGHSNYSCECKPGYTGQDCLEKIDEFEGVDCISNNNYRLKLTLHSFCNPEGKCADTLCSGGSHGYCEGAHPQDQCHYYLHYCQRVTGTPVSYERVKYQGNCSALNTTGEHLNTQNFSFSEAQSILSLPLTEMVS